MEAETSRATAVTEMREAAPEGETTEEIVEQTTGTIAEAKEAEILRA